MPGDPPRSLPRPLRRVKVARGPQIHRDHPHVSTPSLLLNLHQTKTHTVFSVCIRDKKEAFSVKPRFPDEIAYLVLDVQDHEEQNLIRLFPA